MTDKLTNESECLSSKIKDYKEIRKNKGEKHKEKITKETVKVEEQYSKRENPS